MDGFLWLHSGVHCVGEKEGKQSMREVNENTSASSHIIETPQRKLLINKNCPRLFPKQETIESPGQTRN